MRKIVLLAPALLCAAACATASEDTVGPANPSSGACNAAGTEHFVGQPRSDATGVAILKATGATVVRWATPDMMMTMEFRADRVTVHVGTDGRIGRIVCG